MRLESRRDLHRGLTAALGITTAVLVWLHFTGREREMKDAHEEVAKVHAQARNLVGKRVLELRSRLETWVPGSADPPPGFSRVTLAGSDPSPGLAAVVPGSPGAGGGLVRPKAKGDRDEDVFYVLVFSPDTDVGIRQDAEVRGGNEAPYGYALGFQGRGEGTLSVEATLADPPAAGAAPVPLQVLLRRGTLPAEPLPVAGAAPGAAAPLLVASATEPARAEFALRVDDSVRTVRHQVILQTPAGSPRLRVSWGASIGEAQTREVVLGVPRHLPDPETGRPALATTMVLGYAPLDHFMKAIGSAGLLRTEAFGDRLYVTDAAGTVAEALPDFPERIRNRARLEGRTSLSSLATQRVKVRGAATDEYEGFARDRVVGAFGPLEAIHGGLIVEREEKHVLAAYRGLQAWHVLALLFGGLLLWPAVPPVLRRIREDTELPRLLSYARGFVPHFVAIVVTASLYAAGKGYMAYQGKVVMDEVILSGESTASARLESICWLLLLVTVGMFAANWVKEFVGKVIQNRLVMEIRCVLCDKIVGLPMAFHSRQRAGDLLSRIGNDVAETNRGLEMLFGDVISDPILILSMVGTAFWINWRLALVVFVGLPVLALPISYYGNKIKKHARRRQAKKADVTHAISQMLTGIRVVKAFRMEDHESRRIRGISENFLVEALRVARAQVTSKELLEFFSNVSGVIVLGLGGYLVLEKQVTVGDLSAFVLVITSMFKSTKNLTGNYNKMQESLAGTERIFEILDTPDTMADRPSARALVRPRQEIAFEHVSFRYHDDGPWVLRDVSFRVPVGTSVALVGATGSGKSTMLDLVARFYDPQEGRVTVDGVDLRDYSRVGSSRVDLQACKLEYSIVSPK